jgi:pimeloyl-ACP methyl ester carboxylesterase
MATFERGEISIHYEDVGSGPSVLLLAGGGMNSDIGFWSRSGINPLEVYRGEFRLIAMDQRNAGESFGPLDVEDPWGSYIDDQLSLADHLGVDTFATIGSCIGVSFAMKLIERAPERVSASIQLQPIGIVDGDLTGWQTRYRAWASALKERYPAVDANEAEAFGAAMWSEDFIVSVSREFASSCTTPMLVMPGSDVVHPNEVGRELASLVPSAEMIDPWKDTPERVDSTVNAIRDFLFTHVAK